MEEVIEEEGKGRIWKSISWFFVLIISLLLIAYWFIPFDSISFGGVSGNSNFSLVSSNTSMQFYENMRFPGKEISYKIFGCPLQKKNEMERAFEILENETTLNFYELGSGQQISITCDSSNRLEEGLFIAGEGGPTNITKTSNFNVILNGKILLIRDSNCDSPNVALHELFHVLGFEHSSNKNNIMYNISKCGQSIGNDLISSIEELYSTETLVDLSFENVSALMNGKYLNVNVSIRNNGLKDSENFKFKLYADEKLVKETNFEKLAIGYGTTILINNLFINQLSVDELKFEIEYPYGELNKDDNQILLEP